MHSAKVLSSYETKFLCAQGCSSCHGGSIAFVRLLPQWWEAATATVRVKFRCDYVTVSFISNVCDVLTVAIRPRAARELGAEESPTKARQSVAVRIGVARKRCERTLVGERVQCAPWTFRLLRSGACRAEDSNDGIPDRRIALDFWPLLGWESPPLTPRERAQQ